MSTYQFKPAQRAAIYSTHGEKCYLCECLIDLKTMEVDHVIPESLLKKPDQLKLAIEALGLASSFDINSYANWLPACRPCNRKKTDTVFAPSPIIQIVLQNAATKAAAAEKIAKETMSKKEIAKALNVLDRADEDGRLDEEVLQALSKYISQNRQPDLAGKPIRLTPLYEILSEQNGIQIVRGTYGVGGRPAAANSSFACSNCGVGAAWNGTRCVICGEMNDD
ncbi:MAG: HNH endonuclease signature motif containing protein [Burkholderiaceae bacterium]|nr:HNH endonuclease signature motif containing protein [Burkholderiaceae bacterium]